MLRVGIGCLPNPLNILSWTPDFTNVSCSQTHTAFCDTNVDMAPDMELTTEELLAVQASLADYIVATIPTVPPEQQSILVGMWLS